MSTQRTFRVSAIAAPDAVERAKARARLSGLEPLTVVRVAYVETPPAWDVTLAVRPRGSLV